MQDTALNGKALDKHDMRTHSSNRVCVRCGDAIERGAEYADSCGNAYCAECWSQTDDDGKELR